MADIFVPNDGQWPDDAIRVSARTDEFVDFAPLGGGRVYRVSCKYFDASFSPAPDTAPPWRRGRFCIEGCNGSYKGITQGFTWNGWEKPLFTLDVIRRMKWIDLQLDAGTFTLNDDPDCEPIELRTVEFDERIYYDLNDAGICWQKDE